MHITIVSGNLPILPVFVAGEANVSCYRIPALVEASPGTLLAFAEARIAKCSDQTNKMMAMKRSVDSGKTWSPVQFIIGDNTTRIWNPSPVYDRNTKTVILAYLKNRTDCLSRLGGCAAFTIKSNDDGLSWSGPQNMKPFLGIFNNGVRPGPGRAIQLTVPPYSGRLIFSGSYSVVNRSLYYPGDIPPWGRADLVWFSDDNGQSYNLSNARLQGDESALVELSNGSILLNIRRTSVSPHYRLVSRSDDGGVSWSSPTYVTDLISPKCQASIARPNNSSSIFFSNPNHPTQRQNMTVKRSDDNGQTFPHSLQVYSGGSAYSCLSPFSQDLNHIGLLFEHSPNSKENMIGSNIKGPYGDISFAVIPTSF